MLHPQNALHSEQNLALETRRLKMTISKAKSSTKRHFNRHYQSHSVRSSFLFSKVKRLCAALDLKDETFFLTLGISDFLSSKFAFDEDTFRKVTLSSLSLAVKARESQALATQAALGKLQRLLPSLAKEERKVLKEMQFDINLVTPFIFLLAFSRFPDTYLEIPPMQRPTFVRVLSALAFCSSRSYEFNKYKALAVALAILMSARELFGCAQVLPGFLEELTGHSVETLKFFWAQMNRIRRQIKFKVSVN